ncbi:MAG: tRNA 2-thiouridine(34) synthase MnmA [Patescibacteria group bacterium]|nr:tRNA 2-thiouridine(34) synthase MnmA [Patescibacteria group bacterium]
MKNKAVVCAMSGGVDSSVAAALLQKQGYEVIGIFMKLWSEETSQTDLVRENVCCSLEAATAARAVAAKLNIPFYVVNFEEEFKKSVVDYYIKEHENGRTPNPCVVCNRDIKGEILLKKTLEMKADYLATGHYARIGSENGKIQISNDKQKSKCQNPNVKYKLLTAVDKAKDQTYFLWMLKQEHLKHILFPVGDYSKPDIRKMAKKWGLPTAERRESQGICFIPNRDICTFLRRHTKKLTKPGVITDVEGNILGQHSGLIDYTIGQRERLGLGGPKAYFVVKLDSQTNTLIVGDEKDLMQKELIATDLNWLSKPYSDIKAKIRYGHPAENCKLKIINNNQVKVTFKKPQRAVTPGQSIVFYKGEEVLGGGIIN